MVLIDKYTQLSVHYIKEALEWIPYDRFRDIKHIEEKKVCRANWINGYINGWDNENQNWKRFNQNMFVDLKYLNDPKNAIMDELKIDYIVYGITQDPQTKDYMIVLNDKCKKCNRICYAIHFQQNFESWTSGNDDIDKFIQDTQLLAHYSTKGALEWIPYNKFNNIKYIEKIGVYIANWINGHVYNWDYKSQSWERKNQNMCVILKYFNNVENIASVFENSKTTTHIIYGITQELGTKNYMMILNNTCKKCNYECNVTHYQQDINNWTSGNDDIDKFIQDTQLSAHKYTTSALEWIPYNRFYNIKYIAKGGFGKVYKANWIDGYIHKWNKYNNNWERQDKNMFVALKSLNYSKNITLELMNEMIFHHEVEFDHGSVKFYGITQDPETKNYVMVLEYADDGSLRKYLDVNFNKLNWKSKIICINEIITELEFIHENNLIHRDLHIGNILKFQYKTAITDMGLCKPANCNTQKNHIYGVLPYIAPEVLQGKTYTKAADIYSFGIIMYEVISGLPPYHDIRHDEYLAIKICNGIRPRFNIKVPQLIVHLIKRCLDANPLMRPKAEEIRDILYIWQYKSTNKQTLELQAQIKEADVINNNSSNNIKLSTCSGLSYETHLKATYTSRLLEFNNLPEPKNSDDYYKQNDNIISIETSVSLSQQNNVSHLDINDNNLPEPKNSVYEQNDDITSMEYSETLQIDISQLSINKDDKL
ncbi:kinase-like domain-containing protein [Rhizophagus diaphanus]|nr:kinase-like domain-containing protein [Rhizophagus diaphanus] [Rhizophagus sp. MUCL 43196]